MHDGVLEEDSQPRNSSVEANPKELASHLWFLLEQQHSSMVRLARQTPDTQVDDAHIDAINAILTSVISLLSQSGRAQNLHLLEKDKPLTMGDALISLGHYKGSLRAYRISVLKEGPFTF